jgi:sterol desaturase/sphingolipid hydroxylase (fatty acid hydroxylase superfamily)
VLIASIAIVGCLLFLILGSLRPRFAQPAVREGMPADLSHAVVNGLLLDVPLALSLGALSSWIERAFGVGYLGLLRGTSLWLQAAVFLIGGDLVKWTLHMLHHRVPLLWRLHRLHHCTRQMDALSAARMHPIEVYVNRLVFLALFVLVLGIDPRIALAYSVLDVLQGVWIHSNTHVRLRWLNYVLSTQEFHHWHHADDPAARDKNFGGFLSVWDWIFGTAYCPADRTVHGFGIAEMPSPPTGYRQHLLMPFTSARTGASAPRTEDPAPPLHGRQS